MIISFNYIVFIVDIQLDGSRLLVLGECRVAVRGVLQPRKFDGKNLSFT